MKQQKCFLCAFLFVSFVCLFCCAPMCAQGTSDIIITKDGQEIPCLIVEVADSIVKYNRTDRPATVLFSTPVSRISKIVYQNGAVEDYEKTTYSVVVKKETAKEPTTRETPMYIMRSGNDYVYDGMSMRGRVFNNSIYADFLRQNCTPAYEKFRVGTILASFGWSFFTIGLCIDAGFSWWVPYTGYMALVFEVSSIPMLIVGYCQMHKSAEIFNMQCSRNPTCYWSINSGKDGIGLAFNF